MTEDEFELQSIPAKSVDAVMQLLIALTEGPRDAMALLTVVIKRLNSADCRENPPSNKQITEEMLISLNSITRNSLQ